MRKLSVSILFFLTVLLNPGYLSAQVNLRDSSLRISMIYPTYGISMPGGDMKDRFGYSHMIGAGFLVKSESNWCFAVEGNFIFRDGVKNPGSILKGIATSDGFIIDQSGVFANVMLMERGFTAWAKAGKLFPVLGPNPNSGIMVLLGGGMLMHKIRIQDPNNSAPQVQGDYKKGYDHMSSGPALSEYIGFHHLSNSRKLNFYAGIEFTQAFTKSRRAYDYAAMKSLNENYFDMLNSIKIGWYLPFYKKTAQKFYYY
jgi:hypothetical protein